MHVPVTVEMRRRASRPRHAVDLRQAFTLDVGLLDHAQGCRGEQTRQRVKLGAGALRQ